MAAPPELQQLLALARDRTAYQNPLFQAVTQMAYQGLPTYARSGTSLGSLAPGVPGIMPQDGGGGPGSLTSGLLGSLGGIALNSLGGGNALGALISALKKLFLHQQATVQGNRPYGGGTGLTTGNPGLPSFLGWADPSSAPASAPQPNVTTSETYNFDPYNLPSHNPFPTFPGFLPTWPTDPSRGTGVGPGMWNYRTLFPVTPNPGQE